MDLKIIKVGELEENCYIISNGKTIIVDPGDEALPKDLQTLTFTITVRI